jgi:selenocysteine-specific translation elongation factor
MPISILPFSGLLTCQGTWKKGTSTDNYLYNMKKGDLTLTVIEPSRYPEKLSSLFYTASLANLAILVIDSISARLGRSSSCSMLLK